MRVCACVTAHPGWCVGSENIRDGHESAVPLPHIPGPPAQHWRSGAGVSMRSSMMLTSLAAETRSVTCHGSPASLLDRFDFANSNINDEYLNKMNPHHVPDVVRCPSLCCVDEHWPLVESDSTDVHGRNTTVPYSITFHLLYYCNQLNVWTPKGVDQEELRPHQEGEAQELETAGDGPRPWWHGHRWREVGERWTALCMCQYLRRGRIVLWRWWIVWTCAKNARPSCEYISPVTSDQLALFVFRQYQDFLEDLEEDEALRKNVNIYRGEQLHTAAVSTEISALQIIVSTLQMSKYGLFTGCCCLKISLWCHRWTHLTF